MRAVLRLAAAFLLTVAYALAGSVAFTVSMENPQRHFFHVAARYEGLQGETQDFKMPTWTPGYYRILDYAKSVANFRAQDDAGRALPWEKSTQNSWRVVTANSPVVIVSYDVFANVPFVAASFLDADRAFISPPGLYLHVAGSLRQPVTVQFQPPAGWTRISTGLDAVEGRPNTFFAPDFDVLYDCPVLMGGQEFLRFDVSGVPHSIALENVPASVDRTRMMADLKRIVEASVRLIGDLPYRHYAFLLMGAGNGGIEHANSAAISFHGDSLSTEKGYLGWLSYVAHEYFHNYNVKRIRPLALGPFDYERENLTRMLWVSEGLSVYYQDLLLVRAGLMSREQYLSRMGGTMARFENSYGHHYQSATDSSLSTWGTSGVGGDRNTTISYYDNGAMLGAMLDLKIRAESGNRKSLDDVMRALYRKYYQEKNRGFTDAEFRQECESAAGTTLTEVLEYASTTRDVDYAKYFAHGGVRVDVTSEEDARAYLGVNTQSIDGRLVISGVTSASPAQTAGLLPRDEILDVEGTPATPKSINDLLAAKRAGDRIKVRVSRDGVVQELEAELRHDEKRTYRLEPAPNPSPLQSEIWKSWLREER